MASKLMGVRAPQPNATPPERPRMVALVMPYDELVALMDERVARGLALHAANAVDVPPLLTIPETAELLRCSVRTVHRHLACGRLERSQVGGGKIWVTRSSIDQLIAIARRA